MPTMTTTMTNSPRKAPVGVAAAAYPKCHRRVCFSYAAYAKSVISHLRSIGVPVAAGLSDLEFAAVESSFKFEFPPDLRSILREGLPVGAGFPNWRSSSHQQLQLLLALPVNGLLREISTRSLWPESFGLRPSTTSACVSAARGVLESAPVLVPIYRNLYIPSSPPLLNGNPIFFVRGGSVRCSALDLAEFFRQFRAQGEGAVPAPAWAAKSARRVEVWSALADERGAKGEAWRVRELGWRLREGGWREEEVREMLLLEGHDDYDDDDDHHRIERSKREADRMVLRDRDSVAWHVRLLALALLRSGWSTEDVVYCMGSGSGSESSCSSTTEGEGEGEGEVTWHVDPITNEIWMELLR